MRSSHSARHRSWQIRQPAPQSKLRKLSPRACSASFVPVLQKMQINRLFTLSPKMQLYMRLKLYPVIQEKTATEILLLRLVCGATGNRTRDTRIFSPLLYQLSYGTFLYFEVPFFSFGIAKVDIFSLPPNFF